MAEKMTNLAVLRKFFFREGKDTTTSWLTEMKALNKFERADLGKLAAIELGVEIEEQEGK